jgi:hypothetical protein
MLLNSISGQAHMLWPEKKKADAWVYGLFMLLSRTPPPIVQTKPAGRTPLRCRPQVQLPQQPCRQPYRPRCIYEACARPCTTASGMFAWSMKVNRLQMQCKGNGVLKSRRRVEWGAIASPRQILAQCVASTESAGKLRSWQQMQHMDCCDVVSTNGTMYINCYWPVVACCEVADACSVENAPLGIMSSHGCVSMAHI